MPSAKPNPNRKSFSLSLNLQLSRHPKDHGARRDSGFSSPLFPASLHLRQEQPILPIPLTDGLDPSERMKLLKKTRKLSRILGEVPVPVSIEDGFPIADLRYPDFLEQPTPSTSASTSASSSPEKSPPLLERMHPITRSATVGHPGDMQHTGAGVPRARSLASLRPSLTIPPDVVTTRPSPISPVEFSWPEKIPPMPASPTSPVSTSAASATDTLSPLMRRSTSSRHDSTASSVLLQERTPEQVQRARAAKLSRQLGENVPPEILLHASSPAPQPPAAMELPARQPSVKRGRGNRDRSNSKRRLSLDVDTLGRAADAKLDPSFLAETGRVLLKKSNSVSTRVVQPRTGAESSQPQLRLRPMTPDSDSDSELEDADEDDLTVEKQRAMNVWRARKMAQMFGNDPPPALFQITNLRPRRSGDAGSRPVSLALDIPERRKRDSRGTVKSNLLVASPNSESGENLSPLVFAEPQSRPPSTQDISSEQDKSEVLLPYLNSPVESLVDTMGPPPLAVRLTTSTLTSSSQHSISKASLVSLPQCQTPQHPTHAPPTYSPPPFATMFHWTSTPTPATVPSPVLETPLSPNPPDYNPAEIGFRTRRIRAAKLSRFFGVGLQDITGALSGSPIASPSLARAPSGTLPVPPLALPPPKTKADEKYEDEDEGAYAPNPPSPTCMRGFAASGVDAPPSLRRSRKGTAGSKGTVSSRRSLSTTRSTPRTDCQPLPAETAYPTNPTPATAANMQGSYSEEYDRARKSSDLDPAAPMRSRSYSTKVEMASKYSFLEGRRAPRVKELEMHAAIKQLRKIK